MTGCGCRSDSCLPPAVAEHPKTRTVESKTFFDSYALTAETRIDEDDCGWGRVWPLGVWPRGLWQRSLKPPDVHSVSWVRIPPPPPLPQRTAKTIPRHNGGSVFRPPLFRRPLGDLGTAFSAERLGTNLPALQAALALPRIEVRILRFARGNFGYRDRAPDHVCRTMLAFWTSRHSLYVMMHAWPCQEREISN